MNGEIVRIYEQVIDNRQERKLLHKMSDIIVLVFFAILSGAEEWIEYEIFGKEHETFLR